MRETEQHKLYDSDLTHYFGWRTFFFPGLMDTVRDSASDMDVLLFGVFAGKTAIEMCQIFMEENVRPKRIVCFDSFQGVPKELNEASQDIWDPERSSFFKAFNAQMFFGAKTVEATVKAFEDRVQPYVPRGTELVIVPGFFNESLTDELAATMNKALIIDVDVDIYTSTKELLEWLVEHDLMVPGTTLVGYDDWGGSPGFLQELDGESRAHREMVEEHHLQWELVSETDSKAQRVMRYLGR